MYSIQTILKLSFLGCIQKFKQQWILPISGVWVIEELQTTFQNQETIQYGIKINIIWTMDSQADNSMELTQCGCKEI